MLLRALALAALKAKTGQQTPINVLENIVVGRFNSEFSEGKTLISSSEAGGSFQFTLPENFQPADVMALAMECIARINSGEYGDPATLPNVMPKRVIKRLRASFWRAVTS